MTAKIKFTKAVLDKFKPSSEREPCYYDIQQPGLLIRIRKSGRKSFEVRKKLNGRAVRVMLGTYPDMTIEQARKSARSKLNVLSDGGNPNVLNRIKRAETITLAESLDEYLQSREVGSKSLRPNTIAHYQRSIRKNLKAWCNRPISSITRTEIQNKHKSLVKHSVSTADYTMRTFRIIFNYISDIYRDQHGMKILIDNPVSQLNSNRAWSKNVVRSNIIDDNEMPIWYESVVTMSDWLSGTNTKPDMMRDYLLFVLFTGIRRREASNVQKAWIIDDELTIPGEFTKNHQEHSLPLNKYLMDIVNGRISDDTDYLFPGRDINKPLAEPKRIVKKVREKSGIYFTVHDLRRTFASIAGKIVAKEYIVKRLLNHKPSDNDVTASHYVNLTVDDLREPMNKITDYILLNAKQREATVIQLHS
jgi:integrase